MMNLKKSFLIALAIAACLVAFAGTASANSITLSKSPGVFSPSSYSITLFLLGKILIDGHIVVQLQY